MKTDAELQKDVMEEIKWEPCARAAQIGVSAANGVVTLDGTVGTYAEKWAVERAAQRVHGVKGIAQEITVRARRKFMPGPTPRSRRQLSLPSSGTSGYRITSRPSCPRAGSH